MDWLPTLELGKKDYRPKLDNDANAERAERAKKQQQRAVEQQEREAAEKRRQLVESSLPVGQIDFSQPSTSIEEEGNRNEGNDETFSDDHVSSHVTRQTQSLDRFQEFIFVLMKL